MVVGIASVVDHQNLVELLIGAQLCGGRCLLHASSETAGSVLAQFGRRVGRCKERLVHYALLQNRHGNGARASGSAHGQGSVGAATGDSDVFLHGKKRGEDGFCVNLIRIPRTVQPNSAAANVTCRDNVTQGQLALNRQIPLMDGGQLHVLIKYANVGGIG